MSRKGIVIDWIGGNCPVQAEGTFDGEPFYFRARGTGVTLDVGEWGWRGPEYEWPDAGWIGEATARGFIEDAYSEWRHRDTEPHRTIAERRRRNGMDMAAMRDMMLAAELERDMGEAAKPVCDWLKARSDRAWKVAHPARASEGDRT